MESHVEELEKKQGDLLESVRKMRAELAGLLPTQSALEKRTYDTCVAANLSSFKMLRVAQDYYTWPLEQRRKTLGGYSQHHLCKSIIVENTKWDAQFAKVAPGVDPECGDPTFSRFYIVIIQYTTRLMSHKVFKFMRTLRSDITKKWYHPNQAKAEDAARLSGSSYNGVCPVGNPIKVPIIVSQKIVDLKPDFIWLGGGEVDLKLGFSMKEFIEKFNPYISDVAFDGYDFNIPMEGSEDMNE